MLSFIIDLEDLLEINDKLKCESIIATPATILPQKSAGSVLETDSKVAQMRPPRAIHVRSTNSQKKASPNGSLTRSQKAGGGSEKSTPARRKHLKLKKRSSSS